MIRSEQLWETFSRPLGHYIRQRMPDHDSADDVLQEVFLRVHTRLATLQHPERVAAWIYQIARNAIADYYRAQRPRAALPESLAAADDGDDDAAVRALVPCVRTMVEQLPPLYRDAVRITDYGGLSQKALSEQLGISVPGAKSRVQRARAKVKAQLLDCCALAFDAAGRIIDYEPKRACRLSPAGVCGD